MKFFKILILLLVSFFYFNCRNTSEKYPTQSENDVDAARSFIRAALDGKFDEAQSYLLADSINLQYIDLASRNYQRLKSDDIYGYKNASINMHHIKQKNDSTTFIIFSNSYKNDRDTLKVIKNAGKWKVDFKYLYNHPVDSL